MVSASEAAVIVTKPGRGNVVIRCDVGDANGDHLFNLDVSGWPVGQSWELRLDAPAASVHRDLGNPEDTFDGDVDIQIGAAPSGLTWEIGEAIRAIVAGAENAPAPDTIALPDTPRNREIAARVEELHDEFIRDGESEASS